MFARAVNEDTTIQAALKDVILFKNDCEKGDGIAIAKRFEIRGYPTYIALNGNGEVTDRWIGYDGPEAWAASARAAVADPRTIVAKKAAFAEKPTVALAVALGADAATGDDYPNAVAYYKQARNLAPERAAEFNEPILTSMYYGARGGAFTFDEVAAEAKVVLENPDADVDAQVNLTLMLNQLAGQTGQPERAVPYIKAAMKASEGNTDEDLARSLKQLQIQNALLVEKNPEQALAIYRTTFKDGWMDNPGKLNQFAWWCFENDVNLAEAEELALRGVELAADDAERANILDTAAEICSKLGNCDEAVAHMKRAIELDPDKQYFKDQLVRFEKELQEKRNG